MQSEIEDKYSMDMVNKFYENCFTLIRYIGGTLVVLNGTGIVALLSLDIDKYKDALYWFSCGLVSLATIFIFVSIFNHLLLLQFTQVINQFTDSLLFHLKTYLIYYHTGRKITNFL